MRPKPEHGEEHKRDNATGQKTDEDKRAMIMEAKP
jgi:hypothetical protein